MKTSHSDALIHTYTAMAFLSRCNGSPHMLMKVGMLFCVPSSYCLTFDMKSYHCRQNPVGGSGD